MTSRTDLGVAVKGHPTAGFTLIEMIVVLVVLGLTLGLVMARGPMHSAALDARVAARQVAQAMRLARSRAIALDQPVSVSLDIAAHALRIDGSPVETLPRGVGVAAASFTGQPATGRIVAIRFAPDGSSNGGRIALGQGGFVRLVLVDWLTGRVSLDGAG
ncbi:GspH/FimT family pseudopilin [Acidisphaera sp. S103]|uniref:GspH/FimT family pseudopilin n=1 Tax=Acidisphaera sp. S103 TaxID=1747223 RepID=UPI00131B32FA|nr:GspH/FimT family pseudopilin [Acidisphaera sp. S103]